MERQKEQEIKDFLKKVGLEYSTLNFDAEEGKYYIESIFRTFVFISDFGKGVGISLRDSLMDLRDLLEDYIQKIPKEIDEN